MEKICENLPVVELKHFYYFISLKKGAGGMGRKQGTGEGHEDRYLNSTNTPAANRKTNSAKAAWDSDVRSLWDRPFHPFTGSHTAGPSIEVGLAYNKATLINCSVSTLRVCLCLRCCCCCACAHLWVCVITQTCKVTHQRAQRDKGARQRQRDRKTSYSGQLQQLHIRDSLSLIFSAALKHLFHSFLSVRESIPLLVK